MPDNILVDLRFNKIERIWLNDIEDLSVHCNERRYVDIRIEKNPLICNCYLYDLLRYLKDDLSFNVYNFVDINLEYVKCKYPNETDCTEIKELDFRTYVCPEEEYFNIKKCPNSCNCNIRLYDGTRILDCSDRLKSEFKIQKTEINYAGKNPLIANFTYNFLTEIPSLEALQTINVTDLLLSHNWITHVNVERIPETVTILHLDNNYIYTVDGNLINFLTLNPLKEFTLHGNLMECDCSLAPFLTFVKLQRHYYKDLNNVKCKESRLHVYKLSMEYICPLTLDY
ncbi:PREDICTED: protein toll-like [Polistes dominula]|uniref:Protein toll-like n=1 Tax=Polistes dominula TaxID=743375 RepID=A0ABM1JA74_POLDO|nr:PREDICTED: protein toll-like [Polistes dominula]